MPTRRVWRYRPRKPPLTATEWAFFLAKDIADLDRLIEKDGSGFFGLYYMDEWRDCYQDHREEIEREWSRRGWTEEQKRFVMTPYLERGYSLTHDRERAERRQRRLRQIGP